MARIFLGIQIQCANCHNHPYEKWTREDFISLPPSFPGFRFALSLMTQPRLLCDLSISLRGVRRCERTSIPRKHLPGWIRIGMARSPRPKSLA